MNVAKLFRASILAGVWSAASLAGCSADAPAPITLGGDSGAGADAKPPGSNNDGSPTPGDDDDTTPDANPPPPVGDLLPCGDVPVATNHPPFEAIKKLATTNEEVRILVYGQSISLLDWWSMVRDWLKKQYPNGNLVMETHGKGACTAECLVGREGWFTDNKTYNRLPEDVFSWNPDLIMFNVYGDSGEFETDFDYIAKGFVEGCSAFDSHPVATAHCKPTDQFPNYKRPEVLLQTDHRLPGTYPKVDPNIQHTNEVFIPAVAKKYGEQYGMVWWKWADYLDSHDKNASAYLEDGLHLNDKGNVLMASLVEQDLCYNPKK